jgi:hypothetical protein
LTGFLQAGRFKNEGAPAPWSGPFDSQVGGLKPHGHEAMHFQFCGFPIMPENDQFSNNQLGF